MGILARLIYGSHELNINDGVRYKLLPGFRPPAIEEAINMAVGTFRNKRGGEVTGSKPVDRFWDYSIACLGTSHEETNKNLSRLQAFYNLAKDKTDKLFFEFAPSDAITYLPVWGQSVYRYHIKYANAAAWDRYSTALNSQVIVAGIHSLIGPHAEGIKQRVGSAIGGIIEDTIGMTDGRSRGLIIPVLTTNHFANPVFGHATYSTGWTATTLTTSKNTDEKFALAELGGVSARLVNTSTVSAGLWTEQVNVGTTLECTISFYAKRRDGGVIDATVATCRYAGGNATSAYIAQGDGWYRLEANVTGVNAATDAGATVLAEHEIYVTGFQIEVLGYATPACTGVMLGCAWAGTAHASKTTRTAARVRLTAADYIDQFQATIRIAFRAWKDSADLAFVLFDTRDAGTPSFTGGYTTTGTRFNLEDGTNTLNSDAVTFSRGDYIIIHFVWSSAGMKIYKDGTQIGTTASFAPPALATNLHIGSNYTPASQAFGPLSDFTVFDVALSAAEVSADADNLLDAIANGWQVGAIPWLWTKDGDDTVDNCDDSTRDNWAVCGGIPGSDDAQTLWKLNPGQSFDKDLWLGKHVDDLTDWLPPLNRWYVEAQGVADATCSGGEKQAGDLNASPPDESSDYVEQANNIHGVFHFFARLAAEDDGLNPVNTYFFIQHNAGVIEEQTTVGIQITEEIFYLGELYFDPPRELLDTGDLIMKVGTWSNAATALDIYHDFLLVINGPLMRIHIADADFATTQGGLSRPDWVKLSGSTAYVDNGTVGYVALTQGEEILLTPNAYNTIFVIFGTDNAAHVITDTVDMSGCYITPRWALV